jgi:GntP family gluconate:H+ symporter
MLTTHDAGLLLLAGGAVAGVIVLVTWFKFPAFVALVAASLCVGFCAGSNPSDAVKSFSEGVGSVLGSVALILALGAILGKGLAISGGAERIGVTLIKALPESLTLWTIAGAAFFVGIPVFFNAGLVLLIPVVFTAARERGVGLSRFGLPMAVGLSVSHGLVPPHPGPISAVGILHADAGKTILYSLIVGLPVSLIIGGLVAPRLAGGGAKEAVKNHAHGSTSAANAGDTGFAVALITILLPILLMLLAAIADLRLPRTNGFRISADWCGNPLVAMLIGALFSLWVLWRFHGFDRHRLAKMSEESLAPIAAVLLVIGAGGGFSKVLIDAGVGTALARQATSLNVSPLLLGWLTAAFVRVATGSATVAITTGAGLLAPVMDANPGSSRELMVLSMGAGSLVLSHVNDGGFWLVKEYLNLTVTQTLKTWTILETAISLAALGLVLLLQFLVKQL